MRASVTRPAASILTSTLMFTDEGSEIPNLLMSGMTCFTGRAGTCVALVVRSVSELVQAPERVRFGRISFGLRSALAVDLISHRFGLQPSYISHLPCRPLVRTARSGVQGLSLIARTMPETGKPLGLEISSRNVTSSDIGV